mgnify:CR=1 FL=1
MTNHKNKTIPFKIELTVIAHQIPFSPINWLNTYANGIRIAVNVTLTKEGGSVFPNPLKQPAAAYSRHINACDIASIRR